MMEAKKFYLVGQNIKTSLSPLIHNKLFQIKGLDHKYSLYEENVLPSLQDLSNDPSFGGFSITIPFKKRYHENFKCENDLKLLYDEEFAKYSGVINTIVKRTEPNLIFKGYNTDIFGIKKTLGSINFNENSFIFGAGATAETFCYFLQQKEECQNVFVYNRTADKIKELQKLYPKVKSWTDYGKEKIRFIANTLPSQVIKEGKEQFISTIKGLNFTDKIALMDVNYRDQEHIVQNTVESIHKNMSFYSGLSMLIWQAIEQNRLFCNSNQEKDSLQLDYEKQIKSEIENYVLKGGLI